MKNVCLFLLFFLSACSSLPDSKTIKTTEGTFTYHLSGQAKPTVILESGLGDDMNSWRAVISSIAQHSEVLAYNRGGFSGSNSHNAQRNGAIIVEELRTLLGALGLSPPYILVGHSLGGGYMELYARTHPEEVAGVVLVDPNSSKYPARCKAADLDYCDPPSDIPIWASLFLPKAVSGEIRGFAKTHAQINASHHFPDIPVVVLSATKDRANQSEKERKANALYIQMHKELAQLSSRSKWVLCDACSHYIHQDNPQLVIEAIDWIIQQGKKHELSSKPVK